MGDESLPPAPARCFPAQRRSQRGAADGSVATIRPTHYVGRPRGIGRRLKNRKGIWERTLDEFRCKLLLCVFGKYFFRASHHWLQAEGIRSAVETPVGRHHRICLQINMDIKIDSQILTLQYLLTSRRLPLFSSAAIEGIELSEPLQWIPSLLRSTRNRQTRRRCHHHDFRKHVHDFQHQTRVANSSA